MTQPQSEIHAYGLCEDGSLALSDERRTPRALAERALADPGGMKRGSRRRDGHTLGVAFGVSPHCLAQSGWALLTPESWSDDRTARVLAALEPLLALRRAEAKERFVVARFPKHGGVSALLSREGTLGGLLADVEPGEGRLPYYVLLAGGPWEIPWEAQFELARQYAVGRLCFAESEDDDADDVAAFARYAEGVALHEAELAGAEAAAIDTTLFGTSTDKAGRLAWQKLLDPLAHRLGVGGPRPMTQEILRATLGERASWRPSVLFTSSHGVCIRGDVSPHMRAVQGALVCEGSGEVRAFAGDQVESDWNLGGLIAVHFACHSAGTLAGRFVARLPRRMLSVGRAPALAVVGHVESAWSSSFIDFTRPDAPASAGHFAGFVARLRSGWRIGAAFDEELTQRRLAVAAHLARELERLSKLPQLSPVEEVVLSNCWTAEADARTFVILGDPAARLRAEPSR